MVQRFDVDPLIREITFPTYKFPDKQTQQELERIIHPLSFFTDIINVVLERIRHTWPEAYEHILKFVKIICHAPGGDFSSASSRTYTGVIFITSKNKSILSLEDSIVHECGHQVLYNVNEAFPLIKSKVTRTFKLPWSGAERDWFGLLNAFYIYIILAHYLSRFKDRREEEQHWAYERKAHILDGLIKAIPEIEKNEEDFTPSGRDFFSALKHNVIELREQHEPIISKSK